MNSGSVRWSPSVKNEKRAVGVITSDQQGDCVAAKAT